MDHILCRKLVFAFTDMIIYKYMFEECIKVAIRTYYYLRIVGSYILSLYIIFLPTVY